MPTGTSEQRKKLLYSNNTVRLSKPQRNANTIRNEKYTSTTVPVNPAIVVAPRNKF